MTQNTEKTESKICINEECRCTGIDDKCYSCGAAMKKGKWVFEAEVRDINVPDKTAEEELDSLWPYGKPLPDNVTLSRVIDGRVYQMSYAQFKQQILKHFVPKEEVERAFNHGKAVGQYQAADKMYGDVCHIYMFGDNPSSAKAKSISEWSAMGLLRDCEAFMNDNSKEYKHYIAQLTNNQPTHKNGE